MATKTTGPGTNSGEGDLLEPQPNEDPTAVPPPQSSNKRNSAPDGNTQQIELVSEPPTANDYPAEPSERSAKPPAETTLVTDETKPMPAVIWPPPAQHTDSDAPTRPPSLRGSVRRNASQPALPAQTGHNANNLAGVRPGVFTQELRRALPAWALPLLTSQPISVWIAARIGITVLAFLATMMIPAIAANGTANWYGSPGGPNLLPVVDSVAGVWTRWDGQWFLKIATEGYNLNDGSSAFFPLYPWAMSAVGWLAGERFIWAGMLLSSLFFLGALILLHRLVRLDFHNEDAGRAVLYIAAFPMAFFFWAIYSESLFLFLSVGALLAMRGQRWWWAGLCIALAIWTRTTGLLLLLPLAWEMWRAYNPPKPTPAQPSAPVTRFTRPSRFALASLSLPLGALALFVLWSWAIFHDPLAPLSAQAGWNRHFSWPWQTIVGAWNAATQTQLQFQPENQSWTYLGALALALVVGALAVRWLRPSYTIYLWAGILFPLFSATPYNPLLSYPRFLLVLFPAFMVLALLGRNRYAHQIILWLSLLLLGLYTIRFVNWYWVA